MDKEGGMRAVNGLDGNHLAGSPRHLSVQPYVSTISTNSYHQQHFISCCMVKGLNDLLILPKSHNLASLYLLKSRRGCFRRLVCILSI